MFLDLIKTVNAGKIKKNVTENFISTNIPNTITTLGTSTQINEKKHLEVSSDASDTSREASVETFEFDLSDHKVVAFTLDGFAGTHGNLRYYLQLCKGEQDTTTWKTYQIRDNTLRILNHQASRDVSRDLSYALNGSNYGTRKKNLTLAFVVKEKLLYLLENDQVVVKEKVDDFDMDLTGQWRFRVSVWDPSNSLNTGFEIVQLKVDLYS